MFKYQQWEQMLAKAPAVDLTKHITKWSYCVRKIDELNNVLDEAFIPKKIKGKRCSSY